MSSRTTSIACLSAAISTILLASSTGSSAALLVFQPPLNPHSRVIAPHRTMPRNRHDDSQYPVGAIALGLLGELADQSSSFRVASSVKSVQSCLEELGLSEQAG